MKATGIVRKVDELGRVVLPKELRTTMDIQEGTPLEIYTEGDAIVFKLYKPGCYFCGNTNIKIHFGGKPICRACVEKIRTALKDIPQHCEELDAPLTNLDKIRQMPVEKVAKIICDDLIGESLRYCQNKQECNDMLNGDEEIPDEWCQKCAKQWLEREVEG